MDYIKRRRTAVVKVGNVLIGGNNPIVIQSMCNTKTSNVLETVKQINELEKAGCEIVRVAVPDEEAAQAIKEIKKKIHIPIVADIHFNHLLALKAIDNGIDKLRINPGNIGDIDRIEAVVNAAKKNKVPIRIGVNSGSLEKDILKAYGCVTPSGLVTSALRHIKILERLNFNDIVISIKASNVPFSLETYSMLSSEVDYPLHLGITESGVLFGGTIKSSVGIGSILAKGIGDTIRVSLTGDPVEEIKVAKEILKSLELRKFGVELISCPTCSRTSIDLIGLANKVEKILQNVDKNIKVAIMGCAVNGPGEAREADIGIAGGNGEGIIFSKGEIIKKVPEEDLLNVLLEEINKL